MYVALVIVHVIVAITLVLVVLLQAGRGAELGAAFGGLGQTTFGRGQYTFVHKVTTGLAVVFMATSLSLAFISTERPRSSILSPADSQPATSQGQPPAPQPASTAPGAPAAAAPTLPQQTAPAPAGGSTTK